MTFVRSAHGGAYNRCRVKGYGQALGDRSGGSPCRRERSDATPLRQVGLARALAVVGGGLSPLFGKRLRAPQDDTSAARGGVRPRHDRSTAERPTRSTGCTATATGSARNGAA